MSAMESNTDVMEKFGAYSERDATRKKAAKQDKKKRGGGKGKSSQALTAAATSGSNDTKLSGPDVQAPKSKAIVAEASDSESFHSTESYNLDAFALSLIHI